MPRQTLDIGRFDAGIIALPDPKDIPFDAASWSTDVDVDTAPGRLVGRWSDADYEDTPTRVLGATRTEWLEKSDGTYSVVYYQPSTDSLRKVDDFHGTSPGADTALEDFGSTVRTTAMQRMNNTLHIGLGTDIDAKWFGEIDTGQFGGSAPSGFQYLDAELAPPNWLPPFVKIVSDGTYIYGFPWKSQKIYKINGSTGATTLVSSFPFISLQGICGGPAQGSGYIYVYDKTGTYGVLYKISTTDLTIAATYPLIGFGGEDIDIYGNRGSALTLSDIEMSTGGANVIWFIATRVTSDNGLGNVLEGDTTTNGILFKYAEASLSSGTSFYPTNVTWENESGVNTLGRFATADAQVNMVLPKTPFIRSPYSDELIISAYVSGEVIYDTTPQTSAPPPYDSLIIVNTSTAEGDTLASTNCKLVQLLGSTAGHSGGFSWADSTNGGYWFMLPRGDDPGSGSAGTADLYHSTTTGELKLSDITWNGSALPTRAADDSYTVLAGLTEICGAFVSTASNLTTVAIFASSSHGRYYTHIWGEVAMTFSSPSYKRHSPVEIELEEDDTIPGTLMTTNRYYYRISFVYDGFQESPMMPVGTSYDISIKPSGDNKAVKVELELYYSATTVSKRVTSVNLYRAENDADTMLEPSSFFRYVTNIPLESSWDADTSEISTWGEHFRFSYLDIGNIGPSYETNSGIAEGLTTTTLNYQYSAQLLGYHFVGYVKNTLLSATKRMVVRSKQNAFDMFDWTTDFLYMPRDITAMGAYGGSLLVFASNEVYKINPQSMFIEDIYTGIGCLGPQAITETEAGLFFCDLNNMYVYDGRSISPIGDAVKFSPQTTYATPWTFYGTNYTRVVIPFTKMNCVLFCCWKDSEETIQIFVYHIPSKSWRYWTAEGAASDYMGGFQDKNGQAYISHADNLVKVAYTSGTRTSFTWYSQDFTFNDASQKKMIDGIQLVGTSTGSTVTISSDGGTTFAALTDHSYHDTVIVKVTGTYQTDIRTIAIIYRPLLGKPW